MMQRVPCYMAIDFTRWIGICLLEHHNGNWYECYWLKFPSYQMKPVDFGRHEAMCQLVLFWHGLKGLRCDWIPVRDGEKP